MEEKIKELVESLNEATDKCLEKAIKATTREKRKYWSGAANAYSNVVESVCREFNIEIDEK